MTGHEKRCPRCEQEHCCVIEVRRCAELTKLTPPADYAGPYTEETE
jgi:hypothetical protein